MKNHVFTTELTQELSVTFTVLESTWIDSTCTDCSFVRSEQLRNYVTMTTDKKQMKMIHLQLKKENKMWQVSVWNINECNMALPSVASLVTKFVTKKCYYGERVQREVLTLWRPEENDITILLLHISLSTPKMIWITFFMLSCTFYSEATTDLNSHELRYLADHLTNKECRKLHEALKMRHFDLDHKVTGQKEARVPCIILLQFWDKVEAKKSNFQVKPRSITCFGYQCETAVL